MATVAELEHKIEVLFFEYWELAGESGEEDEIYDDAIKALRELAELAGRYEDPSNS